MAPADYPERRSVPQDTVLQDNYPWLGLLSLDGRWVLIPIRTRCPLTASGSSGLGPYLFDNRADKLGSVLIAMAAKCLPRRLQITADADVAALEKLEQMLHKYKEILMMLQ